MSTSGLSGSSSPWWSGAHEATPLLGGYIPVAISFGMVAVQAGFSVWQSILISTLIYAGASQFLFVAMVAAGAPWGLVVVMTLLINARHVVYGPSIAPWLPKSRWWPFLSHGLTDQIFALALSRLPQLPAEQRLGWYSGAMLLAWFSWVAGTAAGAIAGEELSRHWPLLGEIMPFALPALFLVLLAPRFTSRTWSIALGATIAVAMLLTLYGFTNASIPLAAASGALCFYLAKLTIRAGGYRNG